MPSRTNHRIKERRKQFNEPSPEIIKVFSDVVEYYLDRSKFVARLNYLEKKKKDKEHSKELGANHGNSEKTVLGANAPKRKQNNR